MESINLYLKPLDKNNETQQFIHSVSVKVGKRGPDLKPRKSRMGNTFYKESWWEDLPFETQELDDYLRFDIFSSLSVQIQGYVLYQDIYKEHRDYFEHLPQPNFDKYFTSGMDVLYGVYHRKTGLNYLGFASEFISDYEINIYKAAKTLLGRYLLLYLHEYEQDEESNQVIKNDKPKIETLRGRALRFAVLSRDGYKCRYCGRSADEVSLQVDHIVPRSKGGMDDVSNYITACRDCNIGKRDSLLTVSGKGLKLSRVVGGQIPSQILLTVKGKNA
jgi:hypothetical protein